MAAKRQTIAIQPRDDRIVVRILPEPEPLVRWVKEDAHTFNSHHLVPAEDADYRRVILRGEVVAIGPGKLIEACGRAGYVRRPVGVKPGQRVLFTDWNDADLSDYGKDLQMIREGDIIGVVR